LPPAPVKLPGANRILRRPAAGGFLIQWYGWRGKGAPVLGSFSGPTMQAALLAERRGAGQLARAYADARERSEAVETLADLVRAFQVSPDFLKLAASTQELWSYVFRDVCADDAISDLEVSDLEAKGARRVLLAWRDGMKATPRKADYSLGALSRVLNWAVDREYISKNPVAGAAKIYKSNRAKVTVKEPALNKILDGGRPDFREAVEFIRLSGFRRSDAVAVTWEAVDEAAGRIVWLTEKSGRTVEQVAELTPPLRALLASIERRGATILTQQSGKPWKPRALTKAFGRARARAGYTPDMGKSRPHLHDLRGTLATEKVAKALASSEVKEAFGWGRDSTIGKSYVDAATVLEFVAAETQDIDE
jgi:integrase